MVTTVGPQSGELHCNSCSADLVAMYSHVDWPACVMTLQLLYWVLHVHVGDWKLSTVASSHHCKV